MTFKIKGILSELPAACSAFFFFFSSHLFIVFTLKFFNEDWHDKIKISAV